MLSSPIYTFLAVSTPVSQGVLMVEAWIPEGALQAVPAAYRAGKYSKMVVVGFQDASGSRDSATDVAISRLRTMGCDPNSIVGVTVPLEAFRASFSPRLNLEVSRRTVAGAEAVRNWLRSSGTSVCCLDVLTVGVHSRKSWILARHVLGETYRVGVIAAPEPGFDPAHWLTSRRGLYIVSRNVAGYMFAKAWTIANF
jgi:hypothetical protein